MNIFEITKNKKMYISSKSKLYVGENDFEHIQIKMPTEISGNEMSDWLNDIKLYIIKGGLKWSRTLEFELDDEGNYVSNKINIEGAWCLTPGPIVFFVMFSQDTDLGVTNSVALEVEPSRNGELNINYDGVATEDWVSDNFVPDSPDGSTPLINEESGKIDPSYLDVIGGDSSFIYGGFITSVIDNNFFVITPSEAMQERLGTTETSVTVDLTDEAFQLAYYRSNSSFFFRDIKLTPETLVLVADAVNVSVVMTKPGGNIDSFIVRVTPVNGQPPMSGSYPIPTGALCPCTDSQTDENYTMVCVNSRYNGNQWTYTWQRFSDDSNVVHKTGDEVRTGSIKTQNENTSQDYAYSIVADNQIAVKHDSGSGTFMTDDGVKTGDTQYTKYGNRDIYIQRSNYGVTLNMPNSSGTLALKPTSTTATLLSSGWSNGEQTVNVSGVTANNDVFVSIAPSSMSDASASQIYCSAQGNGTLTFVCKSEPSTDISVNIRIEG